MRAPVVLRLVVEGVPCAGLHNRNTNRNKQYWKVGDSTAVKEGGRAAAAGCAADARGDKHAHRGCGAADLDVTAAVALLCHARLAHDERTRLIIYTKPYYDGIALPFMLVILLLWLGEAAFAADTNAATVTIDWATEKVRLRIVLEVN